MVVERVDAPTLTLPHAVRGGGDVKRKSTPRTIGTPSPGFAGGRLGWGQTCISALRAPTLTLPHALRGGGNVKRKSTLRTTGTPSPGSAGGRLGWGQRCLPTSHTPSFLQLSRGRGPNVTNPISCPTIHQPTIFQSATPSTLG